MNKVKKEDTVIFYDREKNKKYFINLALTPKFGTEHGIIEAENVVGVEYGSEVKTHKGYPFLVLPATLHDFIMYKLNRLTQIVYPKDAAYIALRLDVKPGDKIIESGIGSGAMTAVFAHMVGENGKVISYERREEFIKNALSNLRKLGLDHRVTAKNRDIAEGFDETDADALFLDVREPWLYLEHAYRALKKGRMLGILVPTVNQIIKTLEKLEEMPFIDVEVLEILLRHYKTVPERLRPEDRMPAHTAFLIFARKV
ncbi:tRNA (adenine-N1)-methyltransferase [Desulfurobacterium sp.]